MGAEFRYFILTPESRTKVSECALIAKPGTIIYDAIDAWSIWIDILMSGSTKSGELLQGGEIDA
jgi:hypothetical protein